MIKYSTYQDTFTIILYGEIVFHIEKVQNCSVKALYLYSFVYVCVHTNICKNNSKKKRSYQLRFFRAHGRNLSKGTWEEKKEGKRWAYILNKNI